MLSTEQEAEESLRCVCGGKQTQENLVKPGRLGPCELAEDTNCSFPDARKPAKAFKFRLTPVNTILIYPSPAQEAGAGSHNIVSISVS